MMYEERTGAVPLTQRFWALLAHVPVLKSLASKKLEAMNTRDDSAVL